MCPSSLAIVKVGGSLLDWPELPRRLATFLAAPSAPQGEHPERLALIAGGGAAGDLVRAMDRIHGLGDECAHRLALHALDLTAELLASLLPGSVTVQRLEVLGSVWQSGGTPILAPRWLLSEIDARGGDPLPASWDVTTDSIAARIAIHLKAGRLILLKSAGLPAGIGRQQAARMGLVDPMFPLVSRELGHVEYLPFREPNARPRVLPL